MSRPRKLAIGALALLLCAAPFVPRGGGDDGAIAPSGDAPPAARPAATAGFGTVSREARAEIDRVLAEGEAAGRVSARSTPRALARSLARCAELEGQRYCLGTGWTDRTEAEVQARVAAAASPVAARRAGRVEETGDLSTVALLRRTAALPPARRTALERAELEAAARSVAKVWLLRHEIEGVPLPPDFLERHPEARATDAPAARTEAEETTATTQADYPERATIMNGKRTSEQERSYWCGPATMQMIAWGWKNKVKGQEVWAEKLGTTTSGSAISDMVRVVNETTGYDRDTYAGPYVVLDISSYSFDSWMTLLMRHIVDYRAPVVLHPILHKSYYPYLDDDASGHFQVGRGYQKRGEKPGMISYFEPWNQQRFDPSEPYIDRVQWRRAYKSYRANLAHPHQNIGV